MSVRTRASRVSDAKAGYRSSNAVRVERAIDSELDPPKRGKKSSGTKRFGIVVRIGGPGSIPVHEWTIWYATERQRDDGRRSYMDKKRMTIGYQYVKDVDR